MGGGGNGKNGATAGEFEGRNMKAEPVPAGQSVRCGGSLRGHRDHAA